MSAPYFADTNVLVYAYDRDAPAKRERARSLMAELGLRGELGISTQVLKEFYWVTTRRLQRPLSPDQAARAVAALTDYPVVVEDLGLINGAIVRSQSAGIAFWDALIVEAARRARARVLYSEDLQHGQEFDGVRVANPFIEQP